MLESAHRYDHRCVLPGLARGSHCRDQTLKETILMRKAEQERELRRRERLEKEAKDIRTVRVGTISVLFLCSQTDCCSCFGASCSRGTPSNGCLAILLFIGDRDACNRAQGEGTNSWIRRCQRRVRLMTSCALRKHGQTRWSARLTCPAIDCPKQRTS